MANKPISGSICRVDMCELLMILEFRHSDYTDVPLKMFMGGLKTLTINQSTQKMVFIAGDGETYVMERPTESILPLSVTRIAEDVYEIICEDRFFASHVTFVKSKGATLCQLYRNSVFEDERAWKLGVIYLMLNPGELSYNFKEMSTQGFLYSKDLKSEVINGVTYDNDRLFTLGYQEPREDIRLQHLRTKLPNDVLTFSIGESRRLDINVSGRYWDLWFDKEDVKVTEPLNLLTHAVSWEAY